MAKYFPSIEEEHVKFVWKSEPIKEKRSVFYNSCSINDQLINIGDCVLVKQSDGGFAVGVLIKLFEDVGENPFRAKLKWYYKYSEIPKKVRTAWELQGNKEIGEHELFEISEDSMLSPYEEIDAETIYKSCNVQIVPFDFSLQESDSTKYYIRYKLTKTGLVSIINSVNQQQNLSSIKLNQSLKLKNKSGGAVCKEKVSSPDKLKSSYIVCLKTPVIDMGCKVKKRTLIIDKGCHVDKSKATHKMSPNKKATDSLFKNILIEKNKNKKAGKKLYTTEEIINNVNNSDDNEVLSEISESDSSSVCSTKQQSADVLIASNSFQQDNPKMNLTKNSDFKQIRSRPRRTFTSISEKVTNLSTLKKGVMNKSFLLDNTVELSCSESNLKSDKKVKLSNNKRIKKKTDITFDLSSCDSDEDFDVKSEGTESDEKNNNLQKSHKKKISKQIKNTPGSFKKVFKSQGLASTPLLSERSKPLLDAKTPLEKARKRLHVSAVPDCLPCRENEFESILSYVSSRLQEHSGGCMYISGVPGTGKTATVHEVIRRLKSDYSDMVPCFKFIEINGMKLTNPNQAYSAILKLLTGQKATPDHAASLLEKKFCNPEPKKDHVVILVDELDLLWTRKQNVMYNLFDWPARQHSRLVILAVANTMDLPERVMMNRVSSRLGLTRITFQPYNFKQLQEIVLSRITGIEAFEEHALQLVARKVAAVSGDARRCLDICRRAVEIAELSNEKKNPLKGIVGMKHVEIALKEMFSSPKILALQSLSTMEVLFMKAVISEFRRTGLEEALFFEVFEQFRSHCQIEGFFTPNASEAFAICSSLNACKFLLVEPGYKDIYQRIRLNVNKDDVMFAFKCSENK
ncbi:origin recognition complex subunit 1 isoform X4 [Hydra vulgaris]|uniref:Origin recognition complex subunit 1 n=1 Tax=Hydra vulgaris TaxID=6087 RepID=A0ABM4C659_HYDVU